MAFGGWSARLGQIPNFDHFLLKASLTNKKQLRLPKLARGGGSLRFRPVPNVDQFLRLTLADLALQKKSLVCSCFNFGFYIEKSGWRLPGSENDEMDFIDSAVGKVLILQRFVHLAETYFV